MGAAERESRRPYGVADRAAASAAHVLTVVISQDQATRVPGQRSGSARKQKPGLGAGPGHPEPRRKGEMTLSPSKKIMPLDPYSTLGRSCEPAHQVDSPTRGRRWRDDVTRRLAAGPRRRPPGELLAQLNSRRVAARGQVRPILDASCDQALKTDRPRQRAFRDVPGGIFPCRTAPSVRHSATGADPPFHRLSAAAFTPGSA